MNRTRRSAAGEGVGGGGGEGADGQSRVANSRVDRLTECAAAVRGEVDPGHFNLNSRGVAELPERLSRGVGAPALRGEAVEAGAAGVVAGAPLAGDPAPLFHAVERRVERTLFYLKA